MPAVRIKDHWREQRLFDQRALVCAAVMAVATVSLIVRLFVLQVSRHEYYADLSQGNRVRNEPIPAARGLILDRHGEVIAGNQPAYQLELVPEEVPDMQQTLARLVQFDLIRAEDVDELARTIDSSRSFDSVPIRLRMSDEDVARFAVRRFEFPGLDIKTRQTRWYPNAELAVHALGYVGAISEQDLKHIDRAAYAGTSLIGKLGVESAYEHELHGNNGFREVLVNASGRSVERQGAFVPNLRTKAPGAGEDLLLSIDYKVQRTAEAALAGQRSDHVRPRHQRERVRRPAKRHRPSAVQPRAARHLSAGLDREAGDRARRAHLSRGGPAGAPLLRRRLPPARQLAHIPRIPQRAPWLRRS